MLFRCCRLLRAVTVATSTPAAPSARDEAIARLSDDVFSRGNKHLKNVETLSSLPEGLFSFPEVCFIGRPNVGKSSLVSALLHNPRLGKYGRTPGTTRLLQFFNVGDALLLVDTPGYGGWRGRHGLESRVAASANAFSILFRYMALRKQVNLRRVYWLLEASAPGRPFTFTCRDEEIFAFLAREQIPFTVVLTKLDRISRRLSDPANDKTLRFKLTKDGTPLQPAPAAPVGEAEASLPTFEEAVADNMRQVYELLGSDAVPIIGVSCNRWKPHECYNVEALQHDIVSWCCPPGGDSAADLARLTYDELHSLSYSPPLAEDVAAVQAKYPIESFVIPDDNNLSLEHFVRRHEEHKARLVGVRRGTLSARDLDELHLVDARAELERRRGEERQRALTASVPPHLLEATEQVPAIAATGVHDGGMTASPPSPSASAGVASQSSTPRFTSRPRRRDPSLTAEMQLSALDDDDEQTSETTEATDTGSFSSAVAAAATPSSPSHSHITGTSSVSNSAAVERYTVAPAAPSSAPVLPVTVTPHEHLLVAINGVVIPRSLVPPSLAALAAHKEDEMAAFAMRSGAGAYEEILQLDAAGAHDPFTEHDAVSALPEEEADELRARNAVTKKSAARRRTEAILSKYVKRERKERSIYMHAEGYMCPWLAGAGQGTRAAVVGAGASAGATGRGGAVMRDLKSHGFGGKSYSARTLRNKGRATKKTGFWAA